MGRAWRRTEDGTTVITVIGPSKGLRRAGHLFGLHALDHSRHAGRAQTDRRRIPAGGDGRADRKQGHLCRRSAGHPRLTVAECLDAKGKPLAILASWDPRPDAAAAAMPLEGVARYAHAFERAAGTDPRRCRALSGSPREEDRGLKLPQGTRPDPRLKRAFRSSARIGGRPPGLVPGNFLKE